MLYRPEAFEPLTDEPWDEERVRAGIRAIVADADEAYDPDGLWPANEWDAWQTPVPLQDLYVGAAGVVWGVDALRRRGHAEPRIDLAAAAVRALELWRAEPALMAGIELPSTPASSLLSGESGILLVAWRLSPSTDLADALLERVRENLANEADELMWGSPGTLLAANAMHGWTGEERWAEAWRESAEALLDRREAGGLWTQRLYGSVNRYLGPVHGLVGNVHALLRVEDERNEDLRRETAAILAGEAVVEDGLATWQAGAHRPEKGVGLCHGTAGNGYALLKAFARTGDERWLERARRFAVHALSQAARPPGRYSLFTGDVGAALFASSCLDADARFPVLDGWD